MPILAKFPDPNLFSSLPSSLPKPQDSSRCNGPVIPPPPIPIPKYPPPLRSKRPKVPQKPPQSPAFKTVHRNSKYYKPVRGGEEIVAADGDRSVVIGESGVSYLLPGAPFEFQFSYSETPKVKPIAIREPAYLPFAPPTMPRPWTGKAPLKTKHEKEKKKKIPLFDSFNPPPPGKKGVKYVEMPGPFQLGKYPKEGKSREEILGEPLKKWEIKMLVKPYLSDNRQVNLGRDGLTHNMLELVHTHWKRRRVCKVRCRGIPTVDMNNVCHHLEEKTGGKVIYRVGGVVYLFRGRNYNYRTRPQYPVMLWKPATPVYPKLIQEAPEGLTKEEADEMRRKGKKLTPICKLSKNGIYLNLVRDVRNAFEESPLVKVDCRGMHASDYKKLGAKLKELVPCVLLSFDEEHILMWRGRDWKSMYPEPPSAHIPSVHEKPFKDRVDTDDDETLITSPRMMSLWKRALESGKALLLDDTDINPDDILKRVEEFAGLSQAAEHTFPAYILSGGKTTDGSAKDGSETEGFSEYGSSSDESEYEDGAYYSDLSEKTELDVSLGELPVDRLVKKFLEE
ncbi:hypothetical protein SAY86_031458 [Trapa natans]|uniref:CRM domain-containing protein n=1 Tax=Trapa natans TaxID=22666 RepID=A0AAN7R7E8_TRANT|nr:hypothetical protein SAY86_031458 [Trapa natans]